MWQQSHRNQCFPADPFLPNLYKIPFSFWTSMAKSDRTFVFQIDFSERSLSAWKTLLFPISTHFRARKLSNVRFWRNVSVFGVLCKSIGDSVIELNEHSFWKPVSQNNHRSSNTFSHYLQLSKTGRHWVLTLRNGHETVARGEKQRWCYVVGMYVINRRGYMHIIDVTLHAT